MRRWRSSFAVVVAVGIGGISTVAEASDPVGCDEATRCGAVIGRVLVKGEREAVADVRVMALPTPVPGKREDVPAWTRSVRTDGEGRFVLRDVPRGAVRIIVLGEGVPRTEQVAEVVGDATVRADFFVDVDGYSRYRTVVHDRRPVADDRPSSTRLSRTEIETLPGTQGDALRALQSLPGVARPPGGLGFLVLRGAPPGQSMTMVGEHPVPRAFHALPLAGVLPSEAIEEIELVPSNASVRYGGLLGGVMLIQPRRPATDAIHGHAKLDVMGVDASVQGPVGKASYFVAARRGWADLVLERAEEIVGEGFVLPGFWDYQAWVVAPVRKAELEVRVLGAGDRVRSRYDDGVTSIEAFEYRAQFHRIDLVGRWRRPGLRVLLTPSLRLQDDRAEYSLGGNLRKREVAPGWRTELAVDLVRTLELVVGSDGQVVPYRGDETARAITGYYESNTVRGIDAQLGAYALLNWTPSRWRVSPGVRVQGASLSEALMAAVDPRVHARWDVHDRVRLEFGVGRYSQPLVTANVRDGGLVGSAVSDLMVPVALPPAIAEAFEPTVVTSEVRAARVLRAWQGSTTVDAQLPWDLDLRVSGFVRHSLDPGGQSSGFVVPVPRERGLDAGAEILLRKRMSRNLHGWISYTGMRSLRYTDRGGRIPSSFDQPHNLLALASYRLPRGWRIGARFRVASGNPYTQIVGVIEAPYNRRGWIVDLPILLPILGAENGARFPVFHQLDFRVDKVWRMQRAKIGAYLDLQNVYNHSNVEAWIYQPNLRSRAGAFGLPIFPTLGMRIDI